MTGGIFLMSVTEILNILSVARLEEFCYEYLMTLIVFCS